MNRERRPLIGVIGGSECTKEVAKVAEEVGRRIAEKGGILVCGGLEGVMEAAAKGAKEAGGLTVGILPGERADEASPYIDVPIVSGIGYARNTIIVRTADALVAIDGRFGTLSEVAFSLMLEKSVISLGSWEVDKRIIRAENPAHAVDLAFECARRHQ